MLSGALAWTALLVVAAGAGAGFVLTDGFGLLRDGTVVSLSDNCGHESFMVPISIPAGAARHELSVRAGEPFTVPAPEGNGTWVRFEVHAEGVGVAHAHADGTPVRREPHTWSDLLGACTALTPEVEAQGVGPFLAQRDGTIIVHAWRLAGAGS